MHKIINLAATTEVASALQSAWDRGLCPNLADDDFDASRDLRWWRGDDGGLYATAANIVEPASVRRADLEWEHGAGWFAADALVQLR